MRCLLCLPTCCLGCIIMGEPITTITKECPWLTRVINKVVGHTDPQFTWTSVTVSLNSQTEPHRRKFNLQGSQNIVIPIKKPEQGAEVWVEASPDVNSTTMCELSCADQARVGELKPLKGPVYLGPKSGMPPCLGRETAVC